jgi:glycosyltransferase involved in cell wall biosynthesis
MKILISAYACETGRGSEGEIAWRLVNRLAEFHDLWVITRANLQSVHEQIFRESPKPARLHFIYYDLPWVFRFYKRGKRFFLLYYYLWQIGLVFVARQLVRRERFTLVHHLTGGMDWMPSGLALCPSPFVWGPIGSENTHLLIKRHLPWSSRMKDATRVAFRWWMRNLDPFVCLTGARADLILTHTIDTIPRKYLKKTRPFAQTGIEDVPALARPKDDFARGKELRLVFAGELRDWKGARFVVDAALRYFARDPAAHLTVVGDGPLRNHLEAMARSSSEGHRVSFLGRVSMERLVQVLYESDIFLYPSFHHGLATVVLQAMLTGLPVVCLEGDATGRNVGCKAGITVNIEHDRDFVHDLAMAIGTLAADEAYRQRLARQAQHLARETFAYDRLTEALSHNYREVSRGRA